MTRALRMSSGLLLVALLVGWPSAVEASPSVPAQVESTNSKPAPHSVASNSPNSGYWLVASDGGIFTHGGAGFFGSEGARPLNKPVVGMAATPDDQGYWLVASDGGLFTHGDAGFFGSEGATPLNRPIVGMAATPDGLGYWLVASDGGVFTHGDAGFFGSQGATPLNRPIVGMAATPDGKGYWLVGSDGGIFTHGDAGYLGSDAIRARTTPFVGMAATADGQGYWVVGADGGLFPHGDAGFFGAEDGNALNKPIVGMAPSGSSPAITSANSKTTPSGSPFNFMFSAAGTPPPTFTKTGALPGGVNFVDNHNGTAALSGTPAGNGLFPLTITAANGVPPNATQTFLLTVTAPPAITSPNSTTVPVNAPFSFTVNTSATPTPTITKTGALPAGVNFVDNGNGTATLSGTPTAAGVFPLTITAANGLTPNAAQAFTLTVTASPTITSPNSTGASDGTFFTFTVTATGTPTPAISKSGALPGGVTFVDNHDGTATLSGTPTSGGAFPLTITAANGVLPDANQGFTLTVMSAPPSITSANSKNAVDGTFFSFTVTTTGIPTPGITESGALPSGVGFADNGDGTATLSGTPTATGSFPMTFTAANGVSPNAAQGFTLTVVPSTVSPDVTMTHDASENGFFHPPTLAIVAGQTVVWDFTDTEAHDLLPTSGPVILWGVPLSGKTSSGTYSHTFSTPGTYTYECDLHINMTGTLTVNP